MRKILLLIGFVIILIPVFGQVSGTVLDENNSVLPGVNIIIKGTTKGTVSDLNGNFKINVDNGDVLIFQYTGFQNKEITVTSPNQTITVNLVPDVVNMDEVVVMGYSDKTKTEVSSAVAVLNSDELKDVTTDDIGTMLQGKVSGVQVVNQSGEPGSGSQIRIRGISTIKPGNQEPLYVVDGIIGGTFDPNDIASVTVLKDAGATGMYGARANKGVIVVTTKSGSYGKTTINFNASLGMKTPDFGNLKMMSGSQFYDWSKELYRDPQTHDIDIIKFYKFYPKELADRNYDWVNNGFTKAATQQYNLSASGKTEKLNYYVSGVYFNEKGTFMKTGYQKVNLRLNTGYRFNKSVSIRNNINISASKGSYYDYMDMYYTFLALPWDNPYNDDGSLKYIDGNTPGKWWSRDKINPFHTIDNSDHNSKGVGIDYDFMLKVKITDWLSFTSSNRLSYGTDKSHDYVSPVAAGPFHGKGFLRQQQNNWWGAITTNLLHFNFEKKKSSFSGLAGIELDGGSYDYMWAEGKGLPEGFDVPSVASSELKIGGTSTLEYFNSFISQVNYDYDKKYFLTASFRVDKTSNFPPDNNTALFPSISASWLVSNERFFKNISFMDMLKVRTSFGITGDPDIGASRFMGLFSLNSQYNNNPAAIPYQLPNYNLTWEHTNEFNIGVDMSLIKRVSLSVDLYNNVTKDLIVLVAQPLSQGFEHRWENTGQVTNKGIEIDLNTIIVKSKTFEWNFGVNFSRNSNLLSGIENPFYSTINGISQIYRNGAPLYTFIMPKWLGVDVQTGAPLWEKVNTDGTKEPTSIYKDATPQEVGNALPDFLGGANTSVAWKGLTLYVSMAYQYGNDIYNFTRRVMDNDGHEPYINAMVFKPDWSRWERPGDVATHPSMQNAELSTENSSRYLEDGSFFKIRNVSLSYALPKKMVKSMKLTDFVISLRADNVFTWTGFWGQDPEVTLAKGDWSMPGVTDFKYPNNHQFILNINMKF